MNSFHTSRTEGGLLVSGVVDITYGRRQRGGSTVSRQVVGRKELPSLAGPTLKVRKIEMFSTHKGNLERKLLLYTFKCQIRIVAYLHQ